MRVIDIENITEAMRKTNVTKIDKKIKSVDGTWKDSAAATNGETRDFKMRDDTRFVLRCEEVFHDKISAAAASILMNKSKKPLVCLTGPSGSGKTTTAMRLKAYLENLGVKVCLLSMDNFFLPLADRPPELTDWESPLCVNRDLLIDCIHRLSDGEEVELPIYDFKSGTTGSWFRMQGDRDAVIIAEGIHMLNPLIFDRVRDMATGVYVAPRTRIITAHDKIVRPEQLRVARRMIRDYQGRGHSLRQTVERAESVDAGERNYIMPNKPNAGIHIDTFHDYEPCILARYLKEIPEFYNSIVRFVGSSISILSKRDRVCPFVRP